MDVIKLTRSLVDIASVTGEEKELGDFLFAFLESKGWNCIKQEVQPDRFNILALQGKPSILLTTHIDTVPPFFASAEDANFVYGRGACDAKGIAAAMICAAMALFKKGVTDVGLLFVVGEETDSVGATKAVDLDLRCTFVINGEPTDNTLVAAHKGVVSFQIFTSGVAAHSAYPEAGESAIDKLIEILENLKESQFPNDPTLGSTSLNIGKISGGIAANVLADCAQADVLMRTVCESGRYLKILAKVVEERGRLKLLKKSEPQIMESVEGFSTKVVGYGTDIPILRSLGTPLLFGPGSIFEAHKSREKISKKELNDGVEWYQKLVQELRSRP